jgi:hypothetical protein
MDDSGAMTGISRRAGLVAAGVVALVAVPVGFLVWPGSVEPEADVVPERVRVELSARVARLLETDPDEVLIDRREGVLACAVNVLGTEPPAASRVDAVNTAYVWAVCDTVRTEPVSGVSAPVAVHLSDPIRVEMPEDGSGYGPSIRRIFPERLYDIIDGQKYVKDLRSQVDTRAEELR